ncbi:MAG: RNA-directed DNA polymerase [Dissulfurispiraceae bacterium]
MTRPDILDHYYFNVLKPYIKNAWGIDIDSHKETLKDYKNPDYSHITDQTEHRKYIIGNSLWYLYSHFYKVKCAFDTISIELANAKQYTSLIMPGDKCMLDVGAGLLTGTLAYVAFLKENFRLDKDYDKLHFIANESDPFKVELLRENKTNIEKLIKDYLGVVIINACILKWIDHFSVEMYEDINAYSNRSHLVHIEPTDYEDIIEKLSKIQTYKSVKIGRLFNYQGNIPYVYANHPDGPFAWKDAGSGEFKLLYCYETNLEKTFFSKERLSAAYYKARPNIIASQYYDKIDLVIFDKTLTKSLAELSQLLAKEDNNGKPSFKFARTLDYRVHKNISDGKYSFRHMSTRKIDNEIASVAIVEPIAETDSYIEEIASQTCSYGNRLDVRSKLRFYSYFLDAWLEFRSKALNFALSNNYAIFQYDLEKYYENISVAVLTQILGFCSRPKNDFIMDLTATMFNTKCYTTTRKTKCLNCSYEDKDKRDCNERYGLPQGPISSGFYANIYLYPLDEAMTQIKGFGKSFLYLRYVDDIIVVTSEENKNKICSILQDTITQLGLKIGIDKIKTYSAPEFERQHYPISIVDICKESSAYMDLFFYVPDDYYENRTNLNFIRSYQKCLRNLGFNITDIDYLSKKLDRTDNYHSIYTTIFKHKCYGAHSVPYSTIVKFSFPPVAMIDNPVQWCETILKNNPWLNNFINQLRSNIYAKVSETFNAYKQNPDRIIAGQLKSLLFRARCYYDNKYKEIAAEIINSCLYLIPYKLAFDLISGCNNDGLEYYTKLLNELTSSDEKLRDNSLLVAHALKHLGDYYHCKEVFATLVECLDKFYCIKKDEHSDREVINENPYRIKYPSGYIVLLLSLTEAILNIPKEHWAPEKDQIRLFQSLQLLLNMLNIEQTYLKNTEKILYSFKKAIKRNIVTIMATILNSTEFIDLNLVYTSQHVKDILKMYVKGEFEFSGYITSESVNHMPAEFLSDEEVIIS